MRRTHLIMGLASVLAFLLTGQWMHFHHPSMQALDAGVRMMYVSRHIYLLGAALINLTLGIYLREESLGWRKIFQRIGSILILVSPVLLTVAFIAEPAMGLQGRSWRAGLGLQVLFGGVMMQFVSSGRMRAN